VEGAGFSEVSVTKYSYSRVCGVTLDATNTETGHDEFLLPADLPLGMG
jgi:hypothetical protein